MRVRAGGQVDEGAGRCTASVMVRKRERAATRSVAVVHGASSWATVTAGQPCLCSLPAGMPAHPSLTAPPGHPALARCVLPLAATGVAASEAPPVPRCSRSCSKPRTVWSR